MNFIQAVLNLTYGVMHPNEPDEPLWEDFRKDRIGAVRVGRSGHSSSIIKGGSSNQMVNLKNQNCHLMS